MLFGKMDKKSGLFSRDKNICTNYVAFNRVSWERLLITASRCPVRNCEKFFKHSEILWRVGFIRIISHEYCAIFLFLSQTLLCWDFNFHSTFYLSPQKWIFSKPHKASHEKMTFLISIDMIQIGQWCRKHDVSPSNSCIVTCTETQLSCQPSTSKKTG